ncbi:hypothetical protein [Ilumatobacter sp.]|uniref:hypothetical protein n=1 Tax=Ilumatobacter sp. TaxID=1967498 RepID=UPI003C54D48B
MGKQLEALAQNPEQKAYLREIRRRERRATLSTRGRYVAIHLSWIVVLLAGAGVPLAQALGSPAWVAAMLGFVVVAFQGFDRIFGRTSEGSRSMDLLRRRLAREQRLMLAGGGQYAAGVDRIEVFVDRCEDLLLANDDEMVNYFASLAEDRSG